MTNTVISENLDQQKIEPKKFPWWSQLFVFFLSGIFFLSAFLSVFSPLPLLFLFEKKGRTTASLAVILNGIAVFLIRGGLGIFFYGIFTGVLALSLSECLKRKKSLEKAALITLGVMAVTGIVVIGGYAKIAHLNIVAELQNQVAVLVEIFTQTIPNSAVLDPLTLEDLKRKLVWELPSGLVIFAMILIWANLVLLLRINPEGIRERLGIDPTFYRKWRAPEFLVWPTIVCGFFIVLNVGLASDIAETLFKVLMTVYGLQGLSILSYFFDLWNIRSFFRIFGYFITLVFMLPLILSMGFFDLWFDFRAKFRQT